MSADPNKKSPRTFQCRDVLWETFEQMARELECSIDYLINESMKQYARQRSYSPQQGGPGGQPGARPQYPSQPGGASTSPPPGMGHAAPAYGNNGGGFAPPFPPQNGPLGGPMQGGPMGGPMQGGPMGGPPPMQGNRPTGGPPPPPSTGKRPPSLPAPPGRPPGPPGAPPASMRMPPPPGAPPGMGAPPQRRSAPPPPPGMPMGGGMSGGYSNPGMPVGAPPPPPPNYYGGGAGNTGAFPPPPPPPNTAYAPPAAQQAYAPPPPPPPQPQAQAPAPAAGAQLTAYYQGQRFVVNKERFIIGRGKQTSDLTIKDPNVSRQHGMVEFINGQYYMVDMGSTNGVEYNGQRISRKAIAEGDLYRICDHEIRFSYR